MEQPFHNFNRCHRQLAGGICDFLHGYRRRGVFVRACAALRRFEHNCGGTQALHDSTVSHIVGGDDLLLATVMLIFSLGLYGCSSAILTAHGSKSSSKILVINNLDDLKSRLAKVILMIMIVTLFEQALNMKLTTPLDLVYLGASIALIALALYLTHASEHGGGEDAAADGGKAPEKHGH
jgi:uncharacterized membrane protein YqhA